MKVVFFQKADPNPVNNFVLIGELYDAAGARAGELERRKQEMMLTENGAVDKLQPTREAVVGSRNAARKSERGSKRARC